MVAMRSSDEEVKPKLIDRALADAVASSVFTKSMFRRRSLRLGGHFMEEKERDDIPRKKSRSDLPKVGAARHAPREESSLPSSSVASSSSAIQKELQPAAKANASNMAEAAADVAGPSMVACEAATFEATVAATLARLKQLREQLTDERAARERQEKKCEQLLRTVETLRLKWEEKFAKEQEKNRAMSEQVKAKADQEAMWEQKLVTEREKHRIEMEELRKKHRLEEAARRAEWIAKMKKEQEGNRKQMEEIEVKTEDHAALWESNMVKMDEQNRCKMEELKAEWEAKMEKEKEEYRLKMEEHAAREKSEWMNKLMQDQLNFCKRNDEMLQEQRKVLSEHLKNGAMGGSQLQYSLQSAPPPSMSLYNYGTAGPSQASRSSRGHGGRAHSMSTSLRPSTPSNFPAIEPEVIELDLEDVKVEDLE